MGAPRRRAARGSPLREGGRKRQPHVARSDDPDVVRTRASLACDSARCVLTRGRRVEFGVFGEPAASSAARGPRGGGSLRVFARREGCRPHSVWPGSVTHGRQPVRLFASRSESVTTRPAPARARASRGSRAARAHGRSVRGDAVPSSTCAVRGGPGRRTTTPIVDCVTMPRSWFGGVRARCSVTRVRIVARDDRTFRAIARRACVASA